MAHLFEQAIHTHLSTVCPKAVVTVEVEPRPDGHVAVVDHVAAAVVVVQAPLPCREQQVVRDAAPRRQRRGNAGRRATQRDEGGPIPGIPRLQLSS